MHLSDADLVRLQALARLWSRGLPAGLGWADVLNEAIVRVLEGSRPGRRACRCWRSCSGVMRSICDDQWRRCGAKHYPARRRGGTRGDRRGTSPDPERTLAAAQVLGEIDRLFADDRQCCRSSPGSSEGLTRAKSAASTK